ncbi:AI-2E family transporter [Streptomyces pluripotens]|uniref:AI-2E family transporter n=1 Tax=Streptomyces pluripotens TaxID=1355015 RepID=A0A221P6J5_9ACTN|nr:AI-2E family transporter [Streptomyces pluripotens]ASN27923.1 AI-2E family transporter [Streptomyces pluripotens]KIE24365.1 membrane protein [Streptomyces sp. MUSC 125]MCH0559471.1 AI-2E family transporter [Streptomyces sp. MUM 16J]
MGDARRRTAGPGGRRGAEGTVLGSRPGYSVRLPPASRPEPEASTAERTVLWLRIAAAYAWRLILVGIVVYGVFSILGSFQLIAVALFLALVVTSVLRPLADLLNRVLPRPLSVAVAIVGSLLLLLALLALVGNAVAGEWARLLSELRGGVHRIEEWLQRPPFRLSPGKLSDLQRQVTNYVSAHQSTLLSSALSELGRVVELITGGALALFASVFFIHSGEQLWSWMRDQLLPSGARPAWERAGRAAWRTFAGYVRGIIIVAATNAVLVGVALLLLRVPLALPLALLEFFAAFVPLVGSPVALAVATVVALAGRGPLTAAAVLALIVVIGQLEGHVLHPLVLSWAVQLHPLVVAVSVIGGSIVAGVIGAVVAVPFVSVIWAVLRALRALPP